MARSFRADHSHSAQSGFLRHRLEMRQRNLQGGDNSVLVHIRQLTQVSWGVLVARGNGGGTGRSGHWAVGGIGACGRLKVGCAIVTGQGGGLGERGRREAWRRGRTRRRKAVPEQWRNRGELVSAVAVTKTRAWIAVRKRTEQRHERVVAGMGTGENCEPRSRPMPEC